MSEFAASTQAIQVLPEELRSLFWDCRFDTLDWSTHCDFVIGRVLSAGSWDNVQWLRRTVGDDVLRSWIVGRSGGTLSPQQLRFWGLILQIPKSTVDDWLKQEPRTLWFAKAGA